MKVIAIVLICLCLVGCATMGTQTGGQGPGTSTGKDNTFKFTWWDLLAIGAGTALGSLAW
jgi:hypothetical protein